jgi:2-oxoglutarate ferredoxin oxidoreductase subunit delta
MPETLSTRSPKKIVIYKDWCKGCGICAAFCPKVLAMDSLGKATVINSSNCSGCRQCEYHCPDYAIQIGQEVN